MDLQRYLDILRRQALVIVIVTAVTVLVILAAGILLPSVYEARATVRVLMDVGVLDFTLPSAAAERLLNTYSRILKSEPVLREALDQLSPTAPSMGVRNLRNQLEIEVIPDTELMSIVVESRDPVLARDLANILAELMVEYAQDVYIGNSMSARQVVEEQLHGMASELEEDRQKLATLVASGSPDADVDTLQSQIRFKEDSYNGLLERYELTRLNESLRANSITIVEPASLPTRPANALGLIEIGIAVMVGLCGGVGVALVLENLDTRIRSPQQLEYLTDLPLLGITPRGLVSLTDSEHHTNGVGRSADEAYRLLSINIQVLRQDIPLRTILVTSPVSNEDQATVTINLAQALAERGQTVFIIDGDLRHPAIARTLDIEEDGGPGLSGLLSERPTLSGEMLGQVMQPAPQSSLFVISSGPQVSSPTALLATPPMDELLRYLGTQGQTTLLDAPPVLGLADVSVLASKVDGIVLVVRRLHDRRESLQAALKQLQASRARVIGMVLVG
jgi:non-specific protein-tyrosine kinase